ncbi:MAG: hypothetical protein ACRELB_09825, partial [Polyangiaceae bacterium]
SQGLELYESKKEADLSEKKRLAIKADNDQAGATNEMASLETGCATKAAAVDTAAAAASPALTAAQQAQLDTVRADQADLATKQNALDAAIGGYGGFVDSDRDAMYKLERDNDGSSLITGDEDAVKSQYEAHVAAGYTDWKKLDSAVYQAALQTLRDRQPIDDARTAASAAAAKLASDSTAARADATPGSDYANALGDLATTASDYQTSTAAQAEATKASNDAKNQAITDEYNENYSTTGSNVKKAVSDLKIISTAEEGTSLLASVIFAAINYFKSTDELLEANKAWADLGKQLAKAGARHADGSTLAHSFVNPIVPPFHLIKADHGTIVTGEWKTLVHSPIIGIHAHEAEASAIAKLAKDPLVAAEVAKSTSLKAAAATLAAAAAGPAEAYYKALETTAKAVEDLGKATATTRPALATALEAARTAEKAAKKAYIAADKAAAKATTATCDGVLSIGADRMLVLSSIENAEIAVKDELWVTAKKLEIAANERLALESTTENVDVKAVAKQVSIFGKTGVVIHGDVTSMAATAGNSVQADASGVEIGATADKKVAVTGGTISLDAGPAGKIELKAGTCTLTMGPTGFKVSMTAGTAIQLDASQIQATTAGAKVVVAPAAVRAEAGQNKLLVPTMGAVQVSGMAVQVG